VVVDVVVVDVVVGGNVVVVVGVVLPQKISSSFGVLSNLVNRMPGIMGNIPLT